MEQWQDCDAVERHPEKLSGAWVFRGTRVPLAALFENLRDGASIDQFLAWFPGVQRAQVEAVLEHEAIHWGTSHHVCQCGSTIGGGVSVPCGSRPAAIG